jgi:hypothetical protein
MLDRVEGRTKPPIRSGSWTGKRTPAEQARVVISLAPCALEGVEQLLSEFERTLHNGGPVDPERSDAIRALKELRTAITELIDVAETGQLVAANLASLRILKSRTFRWSRETYSLAVAGLPLTTASTVVGCGVMMLVDVLGKGSAEAAAIGVGAMGVHAVAASKRVASN